MKTMFTFLVFSIFLFITFNSSAQQGEGIEYHVVPPAYATTAGTAGFLGPLANSQRTYQLLIHENQLTSIVGKEIKALTWRLLPSAAANWPAAEVTFTNYDIYLSESVPPANRSFTFAENVVPPQSQVRSGSLVIPAGSFTSGSSPNAFGLEIMFNTPYLYTGSHLLIELRHTGFTGTSASIDAVGTAAPGYLSDFSATWVGNYTATTGGLQGNFSAVRLSVDDPIPVELTSFSASVTGKNVELKWTTATEINNYGFEVERKTISSDFEAVGFVTGAGSTTEERNYSFAEAGLVNEKYTYRLKQLDFDGTFEYSYEVEADVNSPAVFSLEQNYPNPFNPSTDISFSLAEAGFVKLIIYNLLGQEVTTLLNENREAGIHTVTFDASSLTSGAYFYKLETPQFTQTRKMILSK
jgi:hypothetical protein